MADDGREAADGDSVHAGKITVIDPGVALDESASNRPHHDESQQQGHEHPGLDPPGEQRKEKIENLFHRKRPEHVPGGGKIAGSALQPVDMESEGGEQGARQGLVRPVDDELWRAREVKDGQKQQQAQQTRNYAGKAHRVKLPDIQIPEAAPALERPAGDEKAGDHEEDAHAEISAPEQDFVGGRAQQLAERSLVEVYADVDVVQDDGDDAEPAKYVNALDTPFRTVDHRET